MLLLVGRFYLAVFTVSHCVGRYCGGTDASHIPPGDEEQSPSFTGADAPCSPFAQAFPKLVRFQKG